MGFFKDFKKAYRAIDKTLGSTKSSAKPSKNSLMNGGTVIGDWRLFRDSSGKTYRYVTEGSRPLEVEDRTEGAIPGVYAIWCSYTTSDRDDANTRDCIARGTNDHLDVWFKVRDDFAPECMTIAVDNTALFFDGEESKLHVIQPDGSHKTKLIGDCDDYAMNTHGFFWWFSNDDGSVQVKAYVAGIEKTLNKKVKPKKYEFDYYDAELKDDGLHLVFIVYADKADSGSNIEFICDYQGDIIEEHH